MLKNSLRRLVAFSIDYPKTVIGIVLAITLLFHSRILFKSLLEYKKSGGYDVQIIL